MAVVQIEAEKQVYTETEYYCLYALIRRKERKKYMLEKYITIPNGYTSKLKNIRRKKKSKKNNL